MGIKPQTTGVSIDIKRQPKILGVCKTGTPSSKALAKHSPRMLQAQYIQVYLQTPSFVIQKRHYSLIEIRHILPGEERLRHRQRSRALGHLVDVIDTQHAESSIRLGIILYATSQPIYPTNSNCPLKKRQRQGKAKKKTHLIPMHLIAHKHMPLELRG